MSRQLPVRFHAPFPGGNEHAEGFIRRFVPQRGDRHHQDPPKRDEDDEQDKNQKAVDQYLKCDFFSRFGRHDGDLS